MNLIEQLKAAYAAATPGEWDFLFNESVAAQELLSGTTMIGMLPNGTSGIGYDNARLIARMHNALPALLEAVEAMEEVIRISDRDHEAWNRVKTALAKLQGE